MREKDFLKQFLIEPVQLGFDLYPMGSLIGYK